MATNDEVQGVLSEIEELSRYQEGVRDIQTSVKEQREEKVTYLCSLLQDPEASTGNLIRDYVLRAFRVLDEEFESRVHALNKRLKGCTGQPVLRHYFALVPAWNLGRKKMGTEQQPRFQCGILDGDELVIGTNPAECAFPMKWHAVENGRSGKESADIEVVEGAIAIPNVAIKNWESVLVFGREEVQTFLTSHRRFLAEDAAFAAFLSSLGYVEMPSEPEQESKSA